MRRSIYSLWFLLLFIPLLSCGQVEIEGKAAPEFTIDKLAGGKISLADYKGKPVMLYWFSGW